MAFSDILLPGDEIELMAPPGYILSKEIVSLTVVTVCDGFEYMPTLWPDVSSETVGPVGPISDADMLAPKAPPPRPPLPPAVPPWARTSNWTLDFPLNLSSLETNETLLLAAGVPQFAIEAAALALEEFLSNVSNVSLTLQAHCLGSGNVTGGLEWSNVPEHADLVLSLGEEIDPSNVTNCTAKAYGAGTAAEFFGNCSNLTATNATNVTVTNGTGKLVQFCVYATWSPIEYTNATDTNDSANGTNGTGDIGTDDIATDENATVFAQELCQWMPLSEVPTNATPIAVRTLSCLGPPRDCSRSQSLTCDSPAVRVQVLWRTSSNLTAEMDTFRDIYQTAANLLGWDDYPLQVTPICLKERMIFQITADGLHPEPEWVNGTTFRFKLGFQSPERPPIAEQNFWVLKHFRNLTVISSDAYQSWEVISKLRYVTILLLNEVLRQTDPAYITIEYVTVNPAKRLHIIAEAPEGWSFTNSYVLEDGVLPAGVVQVEDRRLLWQGFTPDIIMEKGEGTEAVLKFTMVSVQYVRIRLGGVTLPWNGGQALFALFTTGSFSPTTRWSTRSTLAVRRAILQTIPEMFSSCQTGSRTSGARSRTPTS
jgi:hypothetical protein